MTKYVLTCSSTADMSLEYFNKRDIPFISFNYMLDGKEYPDDLDKPYPLRSFIAELRQVLCLLHLR